MIQIPSLSGTQLETPRLMLRPCARADAASLLKLVENNRTFLVHTHPQTEKDVNGLWGARSYLAHKRDEMREGRNLPCGIFLRETQQLIGYVQLFQIDWNVPRGELSYFIDVAFQKQGLMSEAIAALCNHAFTKLNMAKLFLRVAPENTASIRIAEKTGFQLAGKLRHDFRDGNGVLQDVLVYDRIG